MAAKVRRRRDRQMAARARFGAETAARTGNGYIGAKMVRAQLLHYAILRLLGAASLAPFIFFIFRAASTSAPSRRRLTVPAQ